MTSNTITVDVGLLAFGPDGKATSCDLWWPRRRIFLYAILTSQQLQLIPLGPCIVSRTLSTPSKIAGEGVLHGFYVSFNFITQIGPRPGLFDHADVVGNFEADAILQNFSGFCFATTVLPHDNQNGVLDVDVIALLLEGEKIVGERGSDQSRREKLLRLLFFFLGNGNGAAKRDKAVPEP